MHLIKSKSFHVNEFTIRASGLVLAQIGCKHLNLVGKMDAHFFGTGQV
jgi:hypothetical protein